MCVASIVGYKSSQLKQNSQRTVQIYCQYIYAEIIVRNMPNVSSLCPPEDIKHQICGENSERNGLNCVYLHHGIEYSLPVIFIQGKAIISMQLSVIKIAL